MGKGSCSILTEHKTQCMLLMDLQICYLHGFKCAQGFFIHTNFSSHHLILGSTLSKLMFPFPYQRCTFSPVHLKLVKILQTFREWADERRSQCLEIVMERRAWNDQFVSVPRCNRSMPDWPQTFLMVRYSALPAVEDSTKWPSCSCKCEDCKLQLH